MSWAKTSVCEDCKLDHQKEYDRNYYADNRSTKLKRNKTDDYKNYQSYYRETENGKLKRRISQSKRRALIGSNTEININQYIEQLFVDLDTCYYCDNKCSELTIEHILPLSRGGTHTKDNITLACKSCNLKKGNKTEVEFLEFNKQLKGV